jgi:drug/metabolite transporter (DMT)-like permease
MGDTDDLRREKPTPWLMLALVLGVIALAFVLWRVLPDSPITVALLAVAVLAAVGFGVWKLLTQPQFSRAPERRPAPPRDE